MRTLTLINFQIYSKIILTTVIMLYTTSAGLIYFATGSLKVQMFFKNFL